MGAREVQSERLSALDHPGDISIAAQQIVDELASQRFLLANHLTSCCLVPFDQDLDRVVDHAQHRIGGGPHLVPIPTPHDHR